jgi:hypothetical protein
LEQLQPDDRAFLGPLVLPPWLRLRRRLEERNRPICAGWRELGYAPAEGILPSGTPHAAIALGLPDAGSSQAGFWHDYFGRHGVI